MRLASFPWIWTTKESEICRSKLWCKWSFLLDLKRNRSNDTEMPLADWNTIRCFWYPSLGKSQPRPLEFYYTVMVSFLNNYQHESSHQLSTRPWRIVNAWLWVIMWLCNSDRIISCYLTHQTINQFLWDPGLSLLPPYSPTFHGDKNECMHHENECSDHTIECLHKCGSAVSASRGAI